MCVLVTLPSPEEAQIIDVEHHQRRSRQHELIRRHTDELSWTASMAAAVEDGQQRVLQGAINMAYSFFLDYFKFFFFIHMPYFLSYILILLRRQAGVAARTSLRALFQW